MLSLALLSPTGLSSDTISVGMRVPALCLTSMMLGSWSLLQYHFLMTCGEHIVCKRSFYITMTHTFARYNVSKECFRQSVITS